MRLTKKKAIGIAIELWAWLAETGEERKWNWPGRDKYGGYMCASCPLCEYAERKASGEEERCDCCPYYKAFGNCCNGDSPYDMWVYAKTKNERKKYANLFLEQLKQLR